ncbi:TetR/AcrR family transcriptional regulator [Streptomyces longwoodensis]|uniref:TetR/AcrR family transcriptional regulator n=1 Tax=Streptomyces longwoodensis TaxID=68231 RepID=UPI0033D6FB05
MSSPKARNKRQQQGDRSREEILDVASRLMATRGYDGTSISALAKSSGLPASSIYWHFGSKEGVLKAVMERGAARFAAETSVDDVPRDRSPREKVTWVLQRATRLIEESPEFLRLQMILLLSAPTGDANAAVGQLRQRQREGLRDMLALCFAEPGEPAATEIAERLVDLAAATFEGAFLAAQAGSTAHSRTLAQLVDVLIRMAEDEKSRKAP